MLIVYRVSNGEVLDNTGTSSLLPTGPQDDQAWVNIDARNINRAGLALVRLHDVEDAALVEQVLRCGATVSDGVVIPGDQPLTFLEDDPGSAPDLAALVGALRALSPAQTERLQQLLAAPSGG